MRFKGRRLQTDHEALIDEISVGAVEILLPNIQFTRLGTHGETYHGSGMVTMGDDGRLQLRCFMGRELDLRDDRTTQAGQLCPDTDYFSVSAIDIAGREWKCGKMLPAFEGSRKHGLVISSNPDRLDGKRGGLADKNVQYKTITLYYTCELDLPFTHKTITRTSIFNGDQGFSQSIALDRVEIQWREYDLSIWAEANCICVRLHSPGPFLPDGAEDWLAQALQFVTGQLPAYRLCSVEQFGLDTISLHSRQSSFSKSKMRPPLDARHSLIATEDFWKLFIAYIDFVSRSTEGWHPLSYCMASILEDSRGSAVTFATGLSIGIERVASMLYPQYASGSLGERQQVESIRAHLASWQGETQMRERALGAVGAFLSPSGRRALHSLVQNGIISPGLYDSWKKLRNKSAHGVLLEQVGGLQSMLDLIHQNTTLLYQLIFKAIGYEGRYTDYGTHAWPIASFSAMT